MSGHRIHALTGIRGIAAIWVAAFHCYPWAVSMLGGPPRSDVPGVRDGYLAVDLFFILSGFVLCVAYAEKFRLDFGLGLAVFAIARVHRIFPLHWAALAVMLMLVAVQSHAWLGPGPFTAGSFALSAALLQNWDARTALAWNHPAWSLSAEWSAYILFPFLVCALNCLSNRWLAAVSAVFALMTLDGLILHEGSDDLDHVGPPGLIRCWQEFAAGMLAWKAASLGEQTSSKAGDVLVALGTVLLVFAIYDPALQLLAPFAFLALIVGCALPCRSADRFLGNRLCVWLGDVSFSIYLTHVVVLGCFAILTKRLDLLHATLSTKLIAVAALPACILTVSYLTWRYVEIPFQELPRGWMSSHSRHFARASRQ